MRTDQEVIEEVWARLEDWREYWGRQEIREDLEYAWMGEYLTRIRVELRAAEELASIHVDSDCARSHLLSLTALALECLKWCVPEECIPEAAG